MNAELPTCYRSSTPTARIRHRCCECLGVIEPGETYHVFSGVWDGKGETFKTCADCHTIRGEEHDKMRDDVIAFGDLMGHVMETGHAPLIDRCIAIADRRCALQTAAALRKYKAQWVEVES